MNLTGFSFFVGVFNSFRKQNNPEKKLSAAELTSRGFENVYTGCFAFAATPLMAFIGLYTIIDSSKIKNRTKNGALRFIGMAMLPASFIIPAYGAFKIGEGAADLFQSPPSCRQ